MRGKRGVWLPTFESILELNKVLSAHDERPGERLKLDAHAFGESLEILGIDFEFMASLPERHCGIDDWDSFRRLLSWVLRRSHLTRESLRFRNEAVKSNLKQSAFSPVGSCLN